MLVSNYSKSKIIIDSKLKGIYSTLNADRKARINIVDSAWSKIVKDMNLPKIYILKT